MRGHREMEVDGANDDFAIQHPDQDRAFTHQTFDDSSQTLRGSIESQTERQPHQGNLFSTCRCEETQIEIHNIS